MNAFFGLWGEGKIKTKVLSFLSLVFLFFASLQLVALEISPQEYQTLKSDTELIQSYVKKIEDSLQMPKSFHTYKKSYEDYLSTLYGEQSHRSGLIQKLNQSSIILFGDDHSNPRSQENLRWIFEQMATDTRTPIVCMLEWVEEKHQEYLDLYMKSHMDEKELRKKIEFDKIWGFSWSDHFKILQTAKRLGITLIAAENRVMENGDAVHLRSRDNHVVSKLRKVIQSAPNARVVIAYGEYHLAGGNNDPHLKEKTIQVGLSVDLVIYPQSNGYFWKFLEKSLNVSDAEVVRLSNTEFYLNQGNLDKTMHVLEHYLKTVGKPGYLSIIKKRLHTDESVLTRARTCRDVFTP